MLIFHTADQDFIDTEPQMDILAAAHVTALTWVFPCSA